MTDEAELEMLWELTAVCAQASSLVDEDVSLEALNAGMLVWEGLPADVMAQVTAELIAAGFTVDYDMSDRVVLTSPRMGGSVCVAAAVTPRLEQAAAGAVLEFCDLLAGGRPGDAVGRFGAVAVAYAQAGQRGEAFAVVVQHALLVAADVRAGTTFPLDARGELLATLIGDALGDGRDASVRSVAVQRSIREVLRDRPELVDAAQALGAPGQDPLPLEDAPARVRVTPRGPESVGLTASGRQ